jgi:hypothetical protein
LGNSLSFILARASDNFGESFGDNLTIVAVVNLLLFDSSAKYSFGAALLRDCCWCELVI